MTGRSADGGNPGEHDDHVDADVTGNWELIIRTPIGRQEVSLELHRQDGVLAGQARGSAESVPLQNLTVQGQQLTWDQSITRPMRLNLHFDVTVTGDELTGISRAGRLPSSRVTGHRVRPGQDDL